MLPMSFARSGGERAGRRRARGLSLRARLAGAPMHQNLPPRVILRKESAPSGGARARATRMTGRKAVAFLSVVFAAVLSTSAVGQDEPAPIRPETATSICLMAE